MNITSDLKPLLMGAAGGAVALAIVGFTWGGWVTQSTSQMNSKVMATQAVVTALAPICVSQFRLAADAPVKQAELQKIDSWKQGSYVEEAGWATMPGSEAPDAAVAKACAGLIGSLKF